MWNICVEFNNGFYDLSLTRACIHVDILLEWIEE